MHTDGQLHLKSKGQNAAHSLHLTQPHVQGQGGGVAQSPTHGPDSRTPSVRLRFPQKNIQNIHRPLEAHPWNSCVRINHLEKKALPMRLWTLQLQGNVNRKEIKCKTRRHQNVHTAQHHCIEAQSTRQATELGDRDLRGGGWICGWASTARAQ